MIGFPPALWGTLLRLAVGLSLSLLVAGFVAASAQRSDSERHPLFGVIPKAGQAAWNHLEGDGVGYWTSNGVRRIRLPDQSDGRPILLVGDSFTEAIQVSDDEHYGHLLEKALRLEGKRIPILTFGKSGCSVADYIASATNLQAVFKPQWVIIQAQDGDLFDGAWKKVSPGFARFVWGDGRSSIHLVLQPLPRKAQSSSLRQLAQRFPHVVPYSFTYQRVKEFEKWFKTERPWFRAAAPEAARSSPAEWSGFNYPVEEEMELLADAYQHRLTLLYLPPFDPRDPSAPTEGEALLRNLAGKNGIRFVSLKDSFQEMARNGRAPYGFSNTKFNYGHWNRYGHEAAAQLLFSDLMNLGL